MGWTDYLNPIGDAQKLIGGTFSGAKDALGVKDTPQQPGVGGPYSPNNGVPASKRLVQDPSTGYFFDPSTGTTYTDPGGQVPVTNPNVAQQVASNFATAQKLQQGAGQYAQQQQTAFGGENKLTSNLTNFLNGQGGTMAGVQLQQGLDQNNASQLGMVAATGGQNQAGALRNAMNNMAGAGMATNQQAALLRAQEEEAARTALAQTLNNQAQQGTAMFSQQQQAAQGYGQMAAAGQAGQQNMNNQASQFNSTQNLNAAKAIANAGGAGAKTAATM